MSGEVFRLKNWTDYRRKAVPKMHTVMVAIGSVDENAEITEDWIRSQMKALGWWKMTEGE